jgi:hypothetical protein
LPEGHSVSWLLFAGYSLHLLVADVEVGAIATREAYLVKRRSFPDSDVSRFTNDEDGRSGVTGFMPGCPFV